MIKNLEQHKQAVNKLAKISKLLDKLEKKEKETIHFLCGFWAEHITEQRIINVINIFYWQTKFKFMNELAKALKITGNEVVALYIQPQKLICDDCGKEILKRSKNAYCSCDNCAELRKKSRGEEEQEENKRLTLLKTMPYKDYLQTPEWKERSNKHRRSIKNKCQLCNNGGEIHIHHRDYSFRGEERYNDLLGLCAKCHQKFHQELIDSRK